MSIIDSTGRKGNSLEKSADAQTADARPSFRPPRIVLPVPTPSIKVPESTTGSSRHSADSGGNRTPP